MGDMHEPETITISDFRTRVREILENAYFRGRCYIVERAGQEMAVVLGIEDYQRLIRRETAAHDRRWHSTMTGR